MDGSSGESRDVAEGRYSSSATEATEPPDRRIEARHLGVLRRFVGAILTVYWLTLFLATHVPVTEAPVQFRGVDKVVHFVGYGVLGLLLAFWIALRRPLTNKSAVAAVLVLAGYAAVDEVLQIPVGRTCDIADWMCDLLGAGAGVLLIATLSKLRPRFGSRSDEHPLRSDP